MAKKYNITEDRPLSLHFYTRARLRNSPQALPLQSVGELGPIPQRRSVLQLFTPCTPSNPTRLGKILVQYVSSHLSGKQQHDPSTVS